MKFWNIELILLWKFEILLWKFEILSSFLLPVYKISRKNAQPENMCDIVFDEAKCYGRRVNRTSDHAEVIMQLSEVFYKKAVKRNFAKLTIKHLRRVVFFNKVRCCRSAASLKTRLQRRFFLVNFAKFVRTTFFQNTTRRLLLIISV